MSRGKRWCGLAALQWFVALSQATSAEPSMWGSARIPVPNGASVRLELDRREFFIGENVLVHFILENKGDQPFEAEFGGDYRGATRHLRYQVTASDEAGRVAEDPDPSGTCFGGFGGPRTLKPGETYSQSLPLMRYCRILEPGRYTIRVTHDFGWKEGERKRPVGETSVTFRVPTPAEAEAVVAAMGKLPSGPNNSDGQRARDYAAFSSLRHPIYLEPLVQRAAKGDRNALSGLAWIETPEATKALIGLGTNSDPKLALEAAQTLVVRLPNPSLESTNGFGGFSPYTREALRRLVKRSWNPDLAPGVRLLATQLVARADNAEIAAGASMLAAAGTLAEAPAVRTALDRVLDSLVNPRRDPKDNLLNQPDPLPQLISALSVLRDRGYSVDEGQLSGQGAFLLYFTWLDARPPPRSQRWVELLKVFGENCRYPVRVAALNSIPDPVPEECIAFIRERLADPDLGVCRAACTVAGKSGRKEFLKPLIEIIATERHEWLLREATQAATQLGAGFELLDAWANRLAEEQLYGLALDSLQTVIDGLPGSHSGRTDLPRSERIELRDAWRTFLLRHADEIRSGKKFKIEDPALTAALFGRARTWQLADGKSWPPPARQP